MCRFVRRSGLCLIIITINVLNGYNVDEEYFAALNRGSVKVKTLSTSGVTTPNISDTKYLEIFCYEPGHKPTLYRLWMSSCFSILTNGHFNTYFGENASMAFNQFSSPRISLSRFLYADSPVFCFRPFEEQCWAIYTNSLFSVTLTIEEFNGKFAVMSFVGLLLFIFAECFSKTPSFQYIVGTLVGVATFTIMLGLIVAKMFSTKQQFLVLVAASTGLFAFFAKFIWNNLNLILGSYLNYLLIYTFITSSVCFCACYIHGPISNPRAQQVLQWVIQLVAMMTIYFSVSHKPVGLGICLSVFTYNILISHLRKVPSSECRS